MDSVRERHPLHRAVIGGSAQVVTLLLDRGADIHAIHGAGVGSLAGYAPQDMQPIDLAIYAAADFGRLDIVHLLLERGADPTWPDAESSERGAALHAAARSDDREMVELLLKHNADPNGFVNASGNAVCAAKTPEITG
jgi:ankyrin repeat protein